MKKVLLLCFVFLSFVGCTNIQSTPSIEMISQAACVELENFSYNAIVRFDGTTAYITPTNTNANGMTISCNGREVVFTFGDMLKKADISLVSEYNPAILLYTVFHDISNNNPVRQDEDYLYFGKTQIGNYELLVDKNSNLKSLKIKDAHIKMTFESKEKA